MLNQRLIIAYCRSGIGFRRSHRRPWSRAHQFRATFAHACGSAEPAASAAGTGRRPSAAAPRIPMLAISISAVKAPIAPRVQSTIQAKEAEKHGGDQRFPDKA